MALSPIAWFIVSAVGVTALGGGVYTVATAQPEVDRPAGAVSVVPQAAGDDDQDVASVESLPATNDDGGLSDRDDRVEPGDDRDDRVEPGDDRDDRVEPGDDRDDDGRSAEDSDDLYDDSDDSRGDDDSDDADDRWDDDSDDSDDDDEDDDRDDD